MEKTNNNVPPDFEKLKNKLPKSVKNLVFASQICIKNVEYGRYLYSPNSDRIYKFDNDRRYVFTWPSNEGGDEFKWKVELSGDDDVYLKNVAYGRYLYSPNSDRIYKFDNDRRYVFTWKPGKRVTNGVWKIEPSGDNVYIKNVEYGRYLYSPGSYKDFQFDSNRRYVFTWKKGERVTNGVWKIEDYSSTRKRRDVELESKMSLDSGLYIDVNITDKNHSSRKLLTEDSGNQPEIVASSGTRPSSWINDLCGWVKSSIDGLLDSKSSTTTKSPISQVDAQIDVNGTIMLLDVLVRKITGQKYISTVDHPISPLEAQGYALSITEKFEKVVGQAALKSDILMHRLNIDFVEIQKKVTEKIMSGKFDEISGILKLYIEKACPSREAGKLSSKKFDKFMVEFNSGLNVVLNQSIQQILHNGDGRLEVDSAKQMNLEPQSYLSNASVQGHSKNKVSTCLSDIGVTKLGGNLNR